jgi:spermidine synthase
MIPPELLGGEFTYLERHSRTAGLMLMVKRHLVHRQSQFQTLDLFETEDFGKVLTLDGMVMLTERDEAAYHEMLVHVPMLIHPNPRKALVVGGGDGGVLRELLRHPTLEKAVQVEIDRAVVDVSREYFPWAEAVYNNPKVTLVVDDAIKYMRQVKGEFDVVVVDSTDPVGPAEGLFNESFYRDVFGALNEQGIMSGQLGSAFYASEWVGMIIKRLRGIFPYVGLYLAHIPTYPSGLWSLGLASKSTKIDTHPDKVRYDTFSHDLKYYNHQVHFGSFMLPEFLKRATV